MLNFEHESLESHKSFVLKKLNTNYSNDTNMAFEQL